MKLDDRPVIDQLLNPTPLSILEDVTLGMHTLISDREVGLRGPIEETVHEFLGGIRKMLSDGVTESLLPEREASVLRFDEAVANYVVMAAAFECDRRVDLVNEFASELEARL